VQIVSAGGTTIGTRVNAESEELVSAGATASATVVFAGGVLRSKGGTLINPVASGGDILDGPGDPTTGAEIYSGGVLIVETGGEAQDTTVNSGGTLVEAGGTVAGTQNSGGTVVSAALVIVGPKGVISTGSSTSSYSVTSGVTEYVFAGGTADATTIAAGGLLDLAGGTATGGIFFSGGGGTLEIDDVTPTAVISGFVAGDVIDLTGVAFVSGGSATLGGDDVLTVTEGGTNIQLNFDGSVTGDNFSVYADAAGTGTDVAPCYCAGTRIRTPAADIPVEHLAIGDLVQTLGGTAQPIKWIGKRSYAGAFAAVNPNLWPVLIRAGALSDNIPARDLYVSPEHAIYLDKRLIQARLLVNGSSIVVAKHAEVIEYYHIELAAHDVIYAEGAAAETFVDCDSRGMFHNAGEFSALYPGAAPKKWAFCAPMLERGQKLAAIQRRLLTRATKHGIAALQDGPLEGHLDGASGDVIHGWARMVAHPGVAVLLDVLNRGKAIGMVLANQFRADLADAGIGDGRHGFRLQLAKPLDPFEHHEISVRGALDGVELYNSPMIVEPAQAVGSDVIAALTRQVNGARTRTANPEQAEALLDMLLGQTEQVRQRHAELLNGAGPMRQRRGGTKTPVRRALVIDAVWPRPGQDAGSQAILAHMRGLKRLGWHVSLAVKACVRPAETALALLRAEGIVCHVPPAVFTVEEVLARQADSYQLVYLHRNSVARPYVSLIRDYQPHARIVYSVADLHHLRLARQASVEARPELMRHASWMKRHELAAIQQVDAVITHSPAEAALLAKEDTGTAGIHVVPWPVKPALKPRPAYGWDNRSGMVFVANFKHQPNLDGLNWLVSEVMPLVLGEAPEAILTVAGEGLPTSLAQLLAGPSVTLLGHVPDLAPIYNKARLAVAPLRFGAGLKGKVLEAWAHGLPCVMTLTAAEGLPLNGLLSETVARDAAAFARLIITLHTDQSHNAMLASLARQVVRRQFSQKRADAALAMAIAPPSYDNGVVIAWQDGSSKGSK
jgi:autotransporter passenger strand-loop-strand repeat protein